MGSTEHREGGPAVLTVQEIPSTLQRLTLEVTSPAKP